MKCPYRLKESKVCIGESGEFRPIRTDFAECYGTDCMGFENGKCKLMILSGISIRENSEQEGAENDGH